MNSFEIVKRLKAFQKGRPIERGRKINHLIANEKNTLIVAFVRMGGESLPWGIVYGKPGKKPNLLAVADPWDRKDLAKMLAKFSNVLSKHLYHPLFEKKFELTDTPLPQIWVPNITHLQMMHNLAYRYARSTYKEDVKLEELNRLGRTCNFIFQESNRPGQMIAIVATNALKQSFYFPADRIRQGHLGFLLAFLKSSGSYIKILKKAEEAERKTIGISLGPLLEKNFLYDDMQELRQARKKNDTKKIMNLSNKIKDIILSELIHRFELTSETWELLKNDKRGVNDGVIDLENMSKKRLVEDYLNEEFNISFKGMPYKGSVETDSHPIWAAIKYDLQKTSNDLLSDSLIDYDRDIQIQALSSGDAFEGEIVSKNIKKEGKTKGYYWEIKGNMNDPIRLREGSKIRLIGDKKIEAKIVKINQTVEDRIFEIEITYNIRKAQKEYEEGMKVTFVPRIFYNEFFKNKKNNKLWKKDNPGSWLMMK
jgi:hypothetical protein